MSRFGLVGASYTSQSPNADDESCVNWYVENMESPNAKSPLALYPRQGLKIFTTLGGAQVPQLFYFGNRCFGVSGANFYELFVDGTNVSRGTIAQSDNASIAAGPGQILIASAGIMYVFDLMSNTLTPVDPATYVGPVSQVCYVDGFFLALFANSGEFQVSSPDDATTWDLTNVAIVSVFPDNVVGMLPAYRLPLFAGPKQSVFYYDSGNTFPFDVVSGGFIETGLAATYAIAFMDNSIFMLGQDARGQGIASRINGYSQVRVSTFATEYAWSKYPTITDAISYTFQDQGHTFWHIYFPSANKSWRYDAATGLWHEVDWWNGGTPTAHRSQCYCFAFGKHLVGDWRSGNVYEMSLNYQDDFGTPIRRSRRAPAISTELERMFHHFLQLDIETGLGPQPPLLDGEGFPRGPQIFLRWSDDGGHTWSDEQMEDCGQAGEYAKRVFWGRLGEARQRIYEISCSDPVPFRIIDAYLKASPNFETQERYASQIRKVS